VRETVLVVLVLAAGMIPVVLGGPHPAGAVAGAVGGVALLLARSRWPLATMLGTVALYSLPSLAPVLCTSVIAFTAGRRSRPLWRFWLVVTATVVLGLAISLLVEERAELTTTVLVVGAASTVFLVGIPALAGVLLRAAADGPAAARAQRIPGALTGPRRRPGPRGGADVHRGRDARPPRSPAQPDLDARGRARTRRGQDAPRLSGQAELLRTTAGTALAELRQTRSPGRDRDGRRLGAAVRQRAVRADRGPGPRPRDRDHPVDPSAHAGQTYNLSGPAVLDCDGIANGLTEALGRTNPLLPGADQRLSGCGVGDPLLVDVLRATHRWVAYDFENGLVAEENNAVEALTGAAPMSIHDFATSHQSVFASYNAVPNSA
jgi:hypothetical protein